MLEISGHVLIRETGIGIPNLVVAAFDSGRARDSLRNEAPPAEVLKGLGTRISSVLTDADGRFVLPAEDLAFQGNESRPDLVIVVFAPEDVLDPSRPYPPPPDKRALYISLVPRIDAGAREAFRIRLAHRVIGPYLVSADAGSVWTAFERTWAARDAIANSLKARHMQELERRSKARKDAIKRVAGLNAVPVALRNSNFLVTNKADLGRSVKRKGAKITMLESLQSGAMHAGLQRLRSENRTSTLRLHLTKADLKQLGLSIKDGKLSGDKTTLAKLNAVTLRLNGGTDLVHKKADGAANLAQLEQKYLKPLAPPPKKAAAKARPTPQARPRKIPNRPKPSVLGSNS